MALRQIERLAPGRGYVLVDAYRNEAEREIFLGWVLTAITFLKPEEWETLFQEAGYTGDYYWTILDPDPTWNDFAARTTGAGDHPDRPRSGVVSRTSPHRAARWPRRSMSRTRST